VTEVIIVAVPRNRLHEELAIRLYDLHNQSLGEVSVNYVNLRVVAEGIEYITSEDSVICFSRAAMAKTTLFIYINVIHTLLN